MSLKHKNMQLRQKAYGEQQLKDRLALLAGRGIEGKEVDRDPIVRKLKAAVKAVNTRLRAIEAAEKLNQDLAKAKLEKAEAAFKEKQEQLSGKSGKASKADKAGKGEKPAKGEKGEKPKKEKGGEEGKEKKPKAEKKAAPKPAAD
jgi:hypothetical protein